MSTLVVDPTTHEDVREAAVIGVPDDRPGEAIQAFVLLQRSAASTITERTLQEHCLTYLPPFKRPKNIVITKALLKTPLGKVAKEERR